MAENEEIKVEAKERKRKPNFLANEISIITESVTHHFDVINSKLTNNVTNKLKKDPWEEITKQVNAVGRANRSMQGVKDKWKNLYSTAKKEYHSYRRESNKTGWPATETTLIAKTEPLKLASENAKG